MDSKIKRFIKLIGSGSGIVFFGGAGVSTESSIPDFRSSSGLYSNGLHVEKLLSLSYFIDEPESFFNFYFNKMVYPHALPNDAHFALAHLEKEGRLDGIITQNIDGLHSKAGSENV
ncbi:MAG: NAD-dependent protein deacylase, partial [Endomicrobiaceae bacterium]|nr:NAD-dependent protein deacylase [Endomicrobiaceae bacterium]